MKPFSDALILAFTSLRLNGIWTALALLGLHFVRDTAQPILPSTGRSVLVPVQCLRVRNQRVSLARGGRGPTVLRRPTVRVVFFNSKCAR